jgi:hypothetical protein
MSQPSDLTTIRRIAITSVAAEGIALVLILVGFVLGSQRAIIGAGFVIGGLGVLGNLVFRLLWLSAAPSAGSGRPSAARARVASPPRIVIQSIAALVMLWVGVSFFIRSH